MAVVCVCGREVNISISERLMKLIVRLSHVKLLLVLFEAIGCEMYLVCVWWVYELLPMWMSVSMSLRLVIFRMQIKESRCCFHHSVDHWIALLHAALLGEKSAGVHHEVFAIFHIHLEFLRCSIHILLHHGTLQAKILDIKWAWIRNIQSFFWLILRCIAHSIFLVYFK